MSIDLIPHWEFNSGSDWITSLDLIKGKYIFVGSRDGMLHILNWYGAPIYKKNFGSWIGAMKVVETSDASREQTNNIYLLCGTKNGDFRCEKLSQNRSQVLELKEISSFKAHNTIREIDITDGAQESIETWITVASEDRHLYILNLSELLSSRDAAQVKKVRVNGWIRSAAFCKDVDNEKTLIAAGCGDKNLYIFSLEGEKHSKIFIDSKIHSIVSDQRSSKLYCTSDAKKLYVVGLQGISYGIIDEIPLAHRATKLAFMDEEFRRILVVCEDFNIYIFDTDRREIISWIRVGQRVFSINDASFENTDILLLGQSHGRLSAFMYTLTNEPIVPATEYIKGFIGDFNSACLAKLAEFVLFGPKSQSIEVGIGRFIHLAQASELGPSMCIVGTDGDNIAIITLDNDTERKILYKGEKEILFRVWSVYGYWERKGRLRLFVATSENVLLQYVLHTDVKPPTLAEEKQISLKDWPREIRPVNPLEPGGKKQVLISCENGDLIIHGNGEIRFNTEQILRTGYAKQVAEGEYEILVGSDNNLITFFRNQNTIWKKETLDKVREVLITEDGCLAVSEDRYLYILNHEGRLKFRYRFPHRALCIDRYFDYKKNVWFVVGCGDGYVYFVNEHGYIRDAYEFPDRIRDIKIFNNEEIIVACEDRNIYFAPTIEKFFRDYYANRHLRIHRK